MPRSAPGRATGWPSSSTGRWSAVQARDDAEQGRLAAARRPEDADEVVVCTARSVGSSARVGAPSRTPGNVRGDASAMRLGMLSATGPREQPRFAHLNSRSESRPMTPMHDDAEDDLAGVEQRLAVGDHVADAARRADQLGDDHVGPGPAEHEAQRLGDLRRGAGSMTRRTMPPASAPSV